MGGMEDGRCANEGAKALSKERMALLPTRLSTSGLTPGIEGMMVGNINGSMSVGRMNGVHSRQYTRDPHSKAISYLRRQADVALFGKDDEHCLL